MNDFDINLECDGKNFIKTVQWHIPHMEGIGRRKYCCKYPECSNWYYTKLSGGYVNKHFYKFPRNSLSHQLWKKAINVDESTNTNNWVICEDHFYRKDFQNETKQRLNMNAVPIALIDALPHNLVPKIEPPEEEMSTLEILGPRYSYVDRSAMNTCSCIGVPDLLSPRYTDKLHYLQDHNYCLKIGNEVFDGSHSNGSATFHILHDHKYCIRIKDEDIGSNHNKGNLRKLICS